MPNAIAGQPESPTMNPRNNCDPCWFTDLQLRTGSIIIAIFGMFSHPIILCVSLGFFFMHPDYLVQMAALVMAIASIILIPTNAVLFIGALKRKLSLCVCWVVIVVCVTILDLGLAVYFVQNVGFIVFQFTFFFIRCYKIAVVWTYCLELKDTKRRAKEEADTAYENRNGEGDGDAKVMVPSQDPPGLGGSSAVSIDPEPGPAPNT